MNKRIGFFIASFAAAVVILFAAQPKIGDEYAVTLPASTHTTGTVPVWNGTDWIDGTNGASGGGGSIGASLTAGKIPVASGASNIVDGPFAVTAATNVAGAVDMQIYRLKASNSVISAAVQVDALAYNASTWNSSTNVPTRDDVRDEMENRAPKADPIFTSSLQIPNGAAPTTDAFGEIAGDNNAWAASRGAIQFFDGTANTYVVATLASDTPTNGQVPKWNTGGTITWEADNGGTITAGDTQVIFADGANSPAGDAGMTYNKTTDTLTLAGGLATGTSGTGQIDIGSAGVRLTDDGDGAITFLGLGNGSDEDFTINLDDTANTAVISSSTGLNLFDFGSISLRATGFDVANADTTITRSAAGIIAVEGVAVPTISSTDSLSNKTLTSPTVNNPTIVAQTATFPTINYGYLGTNNTSFGFYLTGVTNGSGGTIAQWEAVYIKSDGTIDKADANGSGTYPAWGLATASINNGATGTIITIGNVRNDSWSFTVGATVWLSTTAGAITTTQPSTTGDKIQAIGKAITATQLLLRPSQDYGTSP